MGYIKDLICKTLSIRGVGKIGNSKDRFIKSIWVVFVFSMSSLLLYATAMLVQEFLTYDVVIRLSIKSNDYTTEFPSFSFCHHRPFGPQSEEHWDNKSIMSPTEFNIKLRRKMKDYMDMEQVSPYNLFTQDERRIYYQHLLAHEADKLGWDNETFIMCSILEGSQMEIGLGNLCRFNIKKISIPQFFNCFSVTPIDNNTASRVTSITLLIRLSGDEKGKSRSQNHQKGFIPGILNQLSGLRGMIHERYTFPDIENEGFHLEPGKLVEINYAVIRKTKVSTPKQPCTKEKRESIIDLNQSYLFSQQACFKSLRGQSSLGQCFCFYADTMRSGIPNNTHPYCGNILNVTFDVFFQRVGCLRKWSTEFDKHIKQIFFNDCKPSCTHFTYDISLSVTKWLPTSWQIGWLIEINSADRNFITAQDKKEKGLDYKAEEKIWKNKFENYLNSSDLFEYPQTGKNIDKDNVVMVVIRRRSFDTLESREKLTLDLYNLISRFGGLCSLCLGLTCAFLLEIVEMIYIAINDNKKSTKDESKSPKKDTIRYEIQVEEKTSSESLVWLSSL